jgi:hypothetical protein
MIKRGDIVFLRRAGGIIKDIPKEDKSRIGLVIDEHIEKGCYPQYRVQFKDERKWFHSQYLQKIEKQRGE